MSLFFNNLFIVVICYCLNIFHAFQPQLVLTARDRVQSNESSVSGAELSLRQAAEKKTLLDGDKRVSAQLHSYKHSVSSLAV